MSTAETVKAILSAAPSHPSAGPGATFAVLSNPEFLAEGSAIADLEQQGRVLIGGVCQAPGVAQFSMSGVAQFSVSLDTSLGPDASGDALYRFEAMELKAVNHRLDGALWPRGCEIGTTEQPVVLLEVQMQDKPGFKHRLFAQTARFLQLHPQVLHLAVVVVVPHGRLRLGPAELPFQLEAFLASVHWLSLEELSQQPGLDPLVGLLTLPVLPKLDIRNATKRILQPRPDLVEAVLSILGERFPHLTCEEIMALINLPTDHLRDTRFGRELIEEGRMEGEALGEAKLALRQLNLVCGPLNEATIALIQALPLQQLEALTEALLDFSGPADLAAWLAEHSG